MNALRIVGLCIACIGVVIAISRGNWMAACWATSTGALWIRLLAIS